MLRTLGAGSLRQGAEHRLGKTCWRHCSSRKHACRGHSFRALRQHPLTMVLCHERHITQGDKQSVCVDFLCPKSASGQGTPKPLIGRGVVNDVETSEVLYHLAIGDDGNQLIEFESAQHLNRIGDQRPSVCSMKKFVLLAKAPRPSSREQEANSHDPDVPVCPK